MRLKLAPRDWLILAACIRFIAAFTRVSWNYPDEWYQTVEFSRLLLGKKAIYSHEMALHLRNLSWPLVLALPEWLASFLSPHWTHLKLVFAQLLSGTLDLCALWAFSRLSRNWTAVWRNAGFALLILPWFRVQDSVSLGAEHICVCLVWIALAAIQAESLFCAGVLAVAIFAVKYPAGLVSLGLSAGIFIQALREKKLADLRRYLAGLFCGAILFGAPDWFFYGRPWESFWMYLQYNVLTGSATQAFGRQGVGEYFDFFQSRWLRVLLPAGLAIAYFGIRALVRDTRKLEAWALAFIAYVVGHLLVSHREPRFMFPAEALLLWGALKYGAETWPGWRPRKWAVAAFGLIFVLNFPFFLKAVIAEAGTLNSSYFEVDRRLRDTPNTCAVISQRMLSSILIPEDAIAMGKPAFGFFRAERRRPTFRQAETKPLAWYMKSPQCAPTDSVLLLVDRPDVGWVESGCKLQKSGLLELVPPSLWVAILHRGWVSGPWYACPREILSKFKVQAEETPFINRMARYETLPPLGIDAQQLSKFRDRYSPSVTCEDACP